MKDNTKNCLTKTYDILRIYSGENLRIIGTILVNMFYKNQTVENLPLLVVPGDGPNLPGRNWLMKLKIEWKSLNFIYKHEI